MKNTHTQRTLHLIGIESLIGGTAFTATEVARLRPRYNDAAPVAAGDFVVVATSPRTASVTWYEWGPARRLVRSGTQGGNLALLDVIAHERVAERFTHVVIASGDGIFATPAAELQRRGCSVTVVVRRPADLSHKLRLASRDVRYLEPPAIASIAQARRAA